MKVKSSSLCHPPRLLAEMLYSANISLGFKLMPET
jgi:hypothetical protein